jgi:hypothetical protein
VLNEPVNVNVTGSVNTTVSVSNDTLPVSMDGTAVVSIPGTLPVSIQGLGSWDQTTLTLAWAVFWVVLGWMAMLQMWGRRR